MLGSRASRAAHRLSLFTVAALGLTVLPASAQSLGTFRWQLTPFCNVLTLDVSLAGPVVVVAGFDDLCGDGRGVVTGAAVLNSDGTFGVSLTLTGPDGYRRELRALLDGSLSGPWRDSAGLAGSMTFAPPSPASGSPLSPASLAIGGDALPVNALGPFDAGAGNTAVGHGALRSNTVGRGNTALGRGTLTLNTTGSYNTAIGDSAMFANVTGDSNIAMGRGAGNAGSGNTGVGVFALGQTTGEDNVAVGNDALASNTEGGRNTAVGSGALFRATGSSNIALGESAGDRLGDGSGNIYIGNLGPDLLANTESDHIRIGQSQVATFIAGIANTQLPGGTLVCVGLDGQLGTCLIPSSVHLKGEVAPVAPAGHRLLDLTPVSFRYRPGTVRGGSARTHHGLLAEEVAALYPELAHLDAEGTPVGVRYEALPVLLLSELQSQARELETLRRTHADQLRQLTAELARLRGLVEGTGAAPGR